MRNLGRVALALIATAFVGSAAIAADIPVKAPRMAAPTVYNWSGCYVGLHLGGGWSHKKYVEDPAGSFGGPFDLGGHNGDGLIGGGQVGCNWHFNQTWVWGIEGQFSAAGIDGRHIDPFAARVTSHIDFLGTVAGRIGYAWANSLLYVKGGYAFANEEYEHVTLGTGVTFSGSQSRDGWMVGLGWEYGLSPNWSAKLEWNYMDFGSKELTMSNGVVWRVDQEVHIVKVGVNYRWPVGGVGGGWRW